MPPVYLLHLSFKKENIYGFWHQITLNSLGRGNSTLLEFLMWVWNLNHEILLTLVAAFVFKIIFAHTAVTSVNQELIHQGNCERTDFFYSHIFSYISLSFSIILIEMLLKLLISVLCMALKMLQYFCFGPLLYWLWTNSDEDITPVVSYLFMP